MKTHTNIYEKVTNSIIESLKQGVAPWHKPWQEGTGSVALPLRHNGIAYQGMNIIILWMEALKSGYSSPYWMTFQQAKALGGSVKKGEHGTSISYSNVIKKTTTNLEGEEENSQYSVIKFYSVFNADQIEGLPEQFYGSTNVALTQMQRIESCEALIKATGARIQESNANDASFIPGLDMITMPAIELFDSEEQYYSTLFHELVHWTGHTPRLNRELKAFSSSNNAYAFEELVAEIGAAFLCARIGITLQVPDQHASYVDSWLECLDRNQQMIFKAAGLAQKAVDFLFSLSPEASL